MSDLRQQCHNLLDQIHEDGLTEIVNVLTEAEEFYRETRAPHTAEEWQQARETWKQPGIER